VAVCTHPSPAHSETDFKQGEPLFWEAPAPLRLWHVASLDAPTVAVVWSYGFAWAAHVHLAPWAPFVLALIAWAVYIGDRLLDAGAGMKSPPRHLLRDRHHFHWKHRQILATAGVIAGMAAAVIVCIRLPAGARGPDSAVAAATLAYFSGVHSRRRMWRFVERSFGRFPSRALLIGVLFTAGCLLPMASQVEPAALPSMGRILAIPAVFFAALASLNCYAIGKWESSPSTGTGNGVEGRALLLAAAAAVLAVILGANEARLAGLLAAVAGSSFLMALLERKRGRISPLALRAAADMALLTPAFLLLFGR
jgi:hypothetical protein